MCPVVRGGQSDLTHPTVHPRALCTPWREWKIRVLCAALLSVQLSTAGCAEATVPGRCPRPQAPDSALNSPGPAALMHREPSRHAEWSVAWPHFRATPGYCPMVGSWRQGQAREATACCATGCRACPWLASAAGKAQTAHFQGTKRGAWQGAAEEGPRQLGTKMGEARRSLCCCLADFPLLPSHPSSLLLKQGLTL